MEANRKESESLVQGFEFYCHCDNSKEPAAGKGERNGGEGGETNGHPDRDFLMCETDMELKVGELRSQGSLEDPERNPLWLGKRYFDRLCHRPGGPPSANSTLMASSAATAAADTGNQKKHPRVPASKNASSRPAA